MHRRSGFIVALATAAITFGSLWFSMGPEHFNRGQRFCHAHEHCCMCDEHKTEVCGQPEKQPVKKVVEIKQAITTDSIKK
jgi:hypothetical protein